MTSARLLSTPADGHGLVDKLNDANYHALSNDLPTKPIIALVILDPAQHGGRKTAKGKHRFVSYEVIRLEPVQDLNQANELRYLVQALYEQRTSNGEQKTLPLGLGGDAERQHALIERVEDWATEQGLTGGELEAKWRENFGAGTDDDWSFGDQGVPGDYRKASVAHLLSFGYTVGALSTEEKLPHEDREDDGDDGDDGDASTSDTSDEGEDSGTGQVSDAAAGVACQVCGKKSPALTDGLCPKCCKNVGLPVAAEHVPEAETA